MSTGLAPKPRSSEGSSMDTPRIIRDAVRREAATKKRNPSKDGTDPAQRPQLKQAKLYTAESKQRRKQLKKEKLI